MPDPLAAAAPIVPSRSPIMVPIASGAASSARLLCSGIMLIMVDMLVPARMRGAEDEPTRPPVPVGPTPVGPVPLPAAEDRLPLEGVVVKDAATMPTARGSWTPPGKPTPVPGAKGRPP